MPAMSEANASQTRPWPGSRLAMSSVYSPKSRSPIDRPSACGRPVSPSARATAAKFSAIGLPSASVPTTRYGRTRTTPGPVGRRDRAAAAARGRGRGRPAMPYGSPADRVGHRDGARPTAAAPARVAHDQVRRRPEPVLVERVAADRQRVVDPDRLARDLAAVLVDGEVGREVGGLARSRSRAPRSRGS